jgi:hypothetical protein
MDPLECFKVQCYHAGVPLNNDRVAAGKARQTKMHLHPLSARIAFFYS